MAFCVAFFVRLSCFALLVGIRENRSLILVTAHTCTSINAYNDYLVTRFLSEMVVSADTYMHRSIESSLVKNQRKAQRCPPNCIRKTHMTLSVKPTHDVWSSSVVPPSEFLRCIPRKHIIAMAITRDCSPMLGSQY